MATKKATITYAPNFNDESNPTIKYNNPAGKTVTSLQACISLDGTTADIAYRNISKTGTSYTFNLTTAERTVLREATTGSNSRTVKFIIKTVTDGTTYTDSKLKTLKIINCQPSLSPVLYDNNEKTVALTGDNKILVKHYSNVYYVFNWTTKKYATMSNCKFTCGNKSAYATGSGTIEAVEGGGYEFSATDSRGNTATAIGSLMMVNYIKLTCNVSAEAPTTDGTVNFTIKGNYFNDSFGLKNNVLVLQYRIKANSEDYGDWTETTYTLNGNTYSTTVELTGLDYKNQYTIEARAVDYLDVITSKEIKIKTKPVFDWGENDFNFNVPVTITDDTGTYNLSGLAKAMSNSYTLSTTGSASTNYTLSSTSAVLVGNSLRVGFKATRSTPTGTGNITDEAICAITVTHNGKIANLFNIGFVSGETGAVTSFAVNNISVNSNTATFIIQVNATTVNTSNFGSYFAIPATLNLNAY